MSLKLTVSLHPESDLEILKVKQISKPCSFTVSCLIEKKKNSDVRTSGKYVFLLAPKFLLRNLPHDVRLVAVFNSPLPTPLKSVGKR